MRPFLSQKTVLSGDARFEQTFAYPENACREALVNAIAHRDYSITNPVTVYIYDNQLVFESPGELLSTINILDLQKGAGVHESRNSNVARVLRESKIMRELGEGIRRIFDLMKEQELAPPQIKSSQGKFTISMNHKSIYSEREQMWLALFDGYDFDQYQKRIIIAGIDGRKLSPAIIYAVLGSNDRNLYDRNVTTLRISGVLKEIHTSDYASRVARESGKQKQEIYRFQVVAPDRSKAQVDVSNKVYVYGLDPDVDVATIKAEMSIFGNIVEIRLPIDEKTHQVRGFAFVEFADQTSALKAVAVKNIKIKSSLAGILAYKPHAKKHRKKESNK